MEFAEINKKISFYCSRQTYAMITLELTDNPALVQDILAHSDIKTTMIYAKTQEKTKQEAKKKWDGI